MLLFGYVKLCISFQVIILSFSVPFNRFLFVASSFHRSLSKFFSKNTSRVSLSYFPIAMQNVTIERCLKSQFETPSQKCGITIWG